MFIYRRMFTSSELNRVDELQRANREERPPFLDEELAAEILGRLLRRAVNAVDAGLVNDPIHVGIIYGALLSAAAALCQDYEAAELYIENWRDYDCSELVDFMQENAKKKRGNQ